MLHPPDDIARCGIDTPSEQEINVHDSLDEIVARDHFLNKSVEEGERLFRENSAYYQEDLMWMGPRAFAFYLQSAVNYLKSEFSADDDHLVSCLYDTVVFRMEEAAFGSARPAVEELISVVVDNFAKFNVDRGIYGDVLGRYEALRSDLAASP